MKDTSGVIDDVTVLSSGNLSVKCYPNPNEGEFFVEINMPSVTDQTAEISIINLLGQRVFNNKYQLGKGEIFRKSITILQPGQYFMIVKLNNEYYRTAIVLIKD